MFTNFIQFVKSILQPIQVIFNSFDHNLGILITTCIVFLVALAIKRGVTK